MRFGRRKSNPPFTVNDALASELQDVRDRLNDSGETSAELRHLRPSFRTEFQYHYDEFRGRSSTGYRDPTRDLYLKNDAAEFARLHGVSVPAILATWSIPAKIDWDSLPERFVVKSTVGGGGISVYPLTRSGADFIDGLTGNVVSSKEIVESLEARHKPIASYFAEEYLLAPEGGSSLVPYDVKTFCFYGKVFYVEVRSDDGSRAKTPVSVRGFKPDGTELLGVRPLVKHGLQLPYPRFLPEIVAASENLSAAVRRPFVRLDFFETDQGFYFGEVSDLPGHLPLLRADIDKELGEAYEDALARLYADLAAEGCLSISYGDQSSVPQPSEEFSPATQDHPHLA